MTKRPAKSTKSAQNALVTMLLKLGESPMEKEEFRRDPDAYMDTYGLTTTQQAAIHAALDGNFGPLEEALSSFLPIPGIPPVNTWKVAFLFW